MSPGSLGGAASAACCLCRSRGVLNSGPTGLIEAGSAEKVQRGRKFIGHSYHVYIVSGGIICLLLTADSIFMILYFVAIMYVHQINLEENTYLRIKAVINVSRPRIL